MICANDLQKLYINTFIQSVWLDSELPNIWIHIDLNYRLKYVAPSNIIVDFLLNILNNADAMHMNIVFCTCSLCTMFLAI